MMVTESSKIESIKKQQVTDASLAQQKAAAQQYALSLRLNSENNLLEARKATAQKGKRKSDDAVHPNKTRKPSVSVNEAQTEKKKHNPVIEDDETETLTPNERIKQIRAQHQKTLLFTFQHHGLFSSDTELRAQQTDILTGKRPVTNENTSVVASIQRSILQEEAQQPGTPIFVESELTAVFDVVNEIKSQERQRIAHAVTLADTGTAKPVTFYRDYAKTTRKFESDIHQFATGFITQRQSKQFTSDQLGRLLAAFLEMQFLGSTQRFKDICSERLFTPAFLSQLGMTRARSDKEEEKEAGNHPMGYSAPRVNLKPFALPYR